MPHTDPRDYYVTLRRGKRTALLVGPFTTHTEALQWVDPAQRMASDLDPWAHFDLYGTASLTRDPANPVGKLNERLGVVPRPPY